MSDQKILTEEIAEQFVADGYSVDLSEFTAIDDDAAERLCTLEGRLELNGLTSLSDAAAESLGRHESVLCLNGLTSLSSAAAGGLSGHEKNLELKSLELNGLTSLSETAAESFGRHKVDLSLNGLTSLSDAAAESLSRHMGELNLNSLTSLSDAAAQSLSKHQGSLTLDGLISLSDAAAEDLASHKGDLTLGDSWEECLLSLEGLESITDSQAESFAEREPPPLLSLKEFPETPGHVALAEALVSSNQVYAATDRITVLEPAIAEAFSKVEDHLAFPEVREITLEVASFLAQHKKGNLRLYSVKGVSEPVADVLSKHGPKLFLSNLETLEDTKGHRRLLRKLIKSQDYAEFQFTTLPMWLTEELLGRLTKSRYYNHISFPNLSTISLDVLQRLCSYKSVASYPKCDLRLDGLTELPEGSAEVLDAFDGKISLNGIQ